MSDELYDGYRTAGQHLHGVADWYINQLAEHGLFVFVAVQASVLLTLWCAVGAVLHAAARRRLRRTPAAPDNVPPTNDQLLIACRRIDTGKETP